MLPPAHLPYIPPQPRDLWAAGPALCEQVVVGLFLSSPAPPAFIVRRLVDLVPEVWAYGGVARQQLVISPCPPATGFGVRRRSLHLRSLPDGGRCFRRGSPVRSAIHWAADRARALVATLAMWDRLASHLQSSGTTSSSSPPPDAACAYSYTFSLPRTPW